MADAPAGEALARDPAPLWRNALRIAVPLFMLVGAIALWDFIVRVNDIKPYILPGPAPVAQALVRDWGTLAPALLVTLKITFLSLALAVVAGEQRAGDPEHGGDREHGRQHDRDGGHAWAIARRLARRRCSRASGHIVTTDPNRKTIPASQIRLTSGLTSTLRSTDPLALNCSPMTKRSSARRQSVRIPTSFVGASASGTEVR